MTTKHTLCKYKYVQTIKKSLLYQISCSVNVLFEQFIFVENQLGFTVVMMVRSLDNGGMSVFGEV